jgi:hypothetical protein
MSESISNKAMVSGDLNKEFNRRVSTGIGTTTDDYTC